jgi:phosphocarrier protein HPr
MEPQPGKSFSRTVVVRNKMGIHARPAAMIVRIANRFPGDIWVVKDTEQVNGKSIMGLMMLAAGNGSKLEFLIEDPNGEQFLDEIESLFERKFDEV